MRGGTNSNVRELGLGRFYTYRGLNGWMLYVIKPYSGTSAVAYCMRAKALHYPSRSPVRRQRWSHATMLTSDAFPRRAPFLSKRRSVRSVVPCY